MFIRFWREGLIVILALVCVGLYNTRSAERLVTSTKIEYRDRETIKTVYIERDKKSTTKTVTEKPDGTKITEEKVEVAVEQEKQATKEKETVKINESRTVAADKSAYGIGALIDWNHDVTITGQARLGESPFYGAATYTPATNSVSAGILFMF